MSWAEAKDFCEWLGLPFEPAIARMALEADGDSYRDAVRQPERRKALDELTALSQEMGLYG